MVEQEVIQKRQIYFQPNSAWDSYGARFAGYFFNDTTNAWASFVDTDQDGTYEVVAPDGNWTTMIFVRMAPNSTNDWSNKWTQTKNITIPTDGNNHFTLNSSAGTSGDTHTGSWKKNTLSWTVAGVAALCGTDWDTANVANDMIFDGARGAYIKEYRGVKAGTYTFKVVKDHKWDESYPGSDYSLKVNSNNTTVIIVFKNKTVTVEQHVYEAVATYSLRVPTSNVPATCVTQGITVYQCTDCSDTYQVLTEELGHDWQPVEAADATCNAGGYIAYEKCSLCGAYKEYSRVPVNTANHNYIREVTTEATCTSEGLATFTCADCGASYTEVIPATGHTYSEIEATEDYLATDATCTAAATYYYSCACGAKGTETFSSGEALGHNYESAVTAPTCTTAGYTTYTCTVCGDSYVVGGTAATGHSFTNYVSDSNAACTADGTKTATCDNGCGTKDTIADEGSALGHTDGTAVFENQVAATCTTDGSYDLVVYCTVCKTEISRETTTVDALQHSWNEGTVTTVPTCTTEGEKTYTCTRGNCSATKTETVNALGHAEVTHDGKEATCTEVGYNAYVTCSRCSYTTYQEIPALNHIDENNDCVCDRVGCEYVNHTLVEVQAVAATCSASGNIYHWHCSVCGINYTTEDATEAIADVTTSIDLNNHVNTTTTTVEATCGKDGSITVTCDDCGETVSSTTLPATGAHIGGTATCTALAECEVCGKEYGELGDHSYTSYGSDETHHWQICEYNAEHVTEEVEHEYTDGVCECGATAEKITLYAPNADPVEVVKSEALPTANDYDSKVFAGWSETPYLAETTAAPATLFASGSVYNGEAQALYAVYSRTETIAAQNNFVKVTATTDITNGAKYLIVYESGKLAFDGSLSTLDGTGNTVSVSAITNDTIAISDELKASTFIIAESGNSYTILSASGKYIGRTSDGNEIDESATTKYTNTISFDADGNVNIIGTGNAVLRYNATSGQDRFRYFKSSSYSSQKAIALYKLVESDGSATTYYTIYCVHNYESEVTDPTCDKAGYTTYTCTVCGVSRQEAGEAATGHDYESVVTDPTCTTDGYTTYTCKNDASHTYTGDTVAATGHSYVDGICSACGAEDPKAGLTGWVKTDLVDIKDTDIVIITWTKNGTTYAISSANGASSAPAAVVVTVNGQQLTDGITDSIKWNISNSNGNLTIYPNGTTETWLYCLNNNDGVRVGTNDNKAFTIDASSGYLKNTATNRFVGVYATKPDVRCYDNTTGNIANETIAFYVIVPCTTHTWKDATCTAPQTCSVCGATQGELAAHTEVTDEAVAPTCTATGLTQGSHCSVCETVLVEQEEVAATGHTTNNGVCGNCGQTIGGSSEPETPAEQPVSIDIIANTGTTGTDTISWTSGDVTFTNNKDKSSTAIRTSDTDCYRVYASSQVVISASGGEISKVVITCTSGSYATVMVTSATNAGYTATADGSVVTITGVNASSIEFTASAQTRLNNIVVTYTK